MHLLLRLGVLILAAAATSCASMTSRSVVGQTATGLLYFLPQRDLLVEFETADVDGDCVPTFRVGTSEPYADRTTAFIANLPTLFMAHNESQLAVSTDGLLDNAESHAQSVLSEIIVTAAKSNFAPSIDVAAAGDIVQTVPACEEVSYQWRIPVPTEPGYLGNNLRAQVMPDGSRRYRYHSWQNGWTLLLEPPPAIASTVAAPPKPTHAAGLYYRANIPYRLRIESGEAIETLTVSLPNESPALLAAAPRSVFGAKRATMTFAHGSLTGYAVDFEGDGLQLVSLPARVLASLSGAAGELFAFRHGNAQGEAAAIRAELALEAARAALADCRSALAEDDLQRIRDLCGS